MYASIRLVYLLYQYCYILILKRFHNTSGFGTVQGEIDIVRTKYVVKYPLIKVARPSLFIHYLYIPIITEDDWTGCFVMTFLNFTKSWCKYLHTLDTIIKRYIYYVEHIISFRVFYWKILTIWVCGTLVLKED